MFDAPARAQREACAGAATPRLLNLLGGAREAGRLLGLSYRVALGLVIMGIGLLMVARPELRDDPNHVSVTDVVRGVSSLGAGGAVVLLGWWRYRDEKREARAKTGWGLLSGRSGWVVVLAGLVVLLILFAR